MNDSKRDDPVPEGTTSAIPGRDDANIPDDRDVLEGDRERDVPDRDRDVMGRQVEAAEPDVMGEPGQANSDVMGARRPVVDETLGDDPERGEP